MSWIIFFYLFNCFFLVFFKDSVDFCPLFICLFLYSFAEIFHLFLRDSSIFLKLYLRSFSSTSPVSGCSSLAVVELLLLVMLCCSLCCWVCFYLVFYLSFSPFGVVWAFSPVITPLNASGFKAQMAALQGGVADMVPVTKCFWRSLGSPSGHLALPEVSQAFLPAPVGHF